MRGVGVLIAMMVLLPGWAIAQSVSATVDRSVVSTDGTTFFITVTANGGRIAEPVIPHAEGIHITRTPFSRSMGTSFQSINGNATTVNQRKWVYRAMAQREGDLTIPPITVNVDGKKLSTDPIQLRAEKPAQSALPQTPGANPSQSNAGTQTNNRQPTMDDAVLIRTEVSSQDVYVGEAIELKLKFYKFNSPSVNARYTAGAAVPAPTTEGFYAVPPLPAPLDDAIETENRFEYYVSSWGQRLFPTRPGKLTIGSWHWVGRVVAYTSGGTANRMIDEKTDPIVVNVRPLPDPPRGFSGAVGQFSARATMDTTQLTQGVPATLRIAVQGMGNPDAIGAPKLPDIAKAQVSGPDIEISNLPQDRGIEKVFSYSLVPVEPGALEVPPIEYVYFAPAIRQYKTIKTNAIPCTVTESSENTELIVSGGSTAGSSDSVRVVGSDIRAIVSTPRGLTIGRSTWPENTVFALFPPIGFGIFALFMRRQKKFSNDTGYARKYHARTKSQKRLAKVATSDTPTETLYRAVIGYIADTFNANEAGMTSGDARMILLERGIPAELIDTAVKVLKSCERAHYGGNELSAQEIGALTDAAGSMMDATDAIVKKKGR